MIIWALHGDYGFATLIVKSEKFNVIKLYIHESESSVGSVGGNNKN
jgi:hypothetical protein